MLGVDPRPLVVLATHNHAESLLVVLAAGVTGTASGAALWMLVVLAAGTASGAAP